MAKLFEFPGKGEVDGWGDIDRGIRSELESIGASQEVQSLVVSAMEKFFDQFKFEMRFQAEIAYPGILSERQVAAITEQIRGKIFDHQRAYAAKFQRELFRERLAREVEFCRVSGLL